MRPSSCSAAFLRPHIRQAHKPMTPRIIAPPTPTTTPMIVLRVCGDMPVLLLLLPLWFGSGTRTVGVVTVSEVLVEMEPSVLVTVSITVLVVGGRVLVILGGSEVLVSDGASLLLEEESVGLGFVEVGCVVGWSEGVGEGVAEEVGLFVVGAGGEVVEGGAFDEAEVGWAVFPGAEDALDRVCLLTRRSSKPFTSRLSAFATPSWSATTPCSLIGRP